MFNAQISILRTMPVLSRWYNEGRSRSKVIIPPPTIVTSRLTADGRISSLPSRWLKAHPATKKILSNRTAPAGSGQNIRNFGSRRTRLRLRVLSSWARSLKTVKLPAARKTCKCSSQIIFQGLELKSKRSPPQPCPYLVTSTCTGRISRSTLIVASMGTVAARKNAG